MSSSEGETVVTSSPPLYPVRPAAAAHPRMGSHDEERHSRVLTYLPSVYPFFHPPRFPPREREKGEEKVAKNAPKELSWKGGGRRKEEPNDTLTSWGSSLSPLPPFPPIPPPRQFVSPFLRRSPGCAVGLKRSSAEEKKERGEETQLFPFSLLLRAIPLPPFLPFPPSFFYAPRKKKR